MSETTDLIARLRDNAQGIGLGAEGMGWGFDEAMLNEAADALEQQAADLAYVKAASVFNLMEENKRQAAQIEALRADATRYRWLRMRDWFNSELCVLRDPKRVLTEGIGLGADCPSLSRLDAAIDAALRQEQPT